MVRAVDPRSTWDYVLLAERELPPEERTTFRLRPLTAREQAQVEDTALTTGPDGRVYSLNTGTHALTILRLGLVGWEGFADEDGRPVPFAKNGSGTVSEACLDAIPSRVRHELANAITEQTKVSEGDRGN